MLDETKALDPPHLNSKTKSNRSWTLLATISVKKSTMFAAIRDNMSSDQSEQLATQFKSAKSQLQDKMAGVS